MIDLPIEPEDSYNRLNGNKEFKRRNREFGSLQDFKKEFPHNDSILRKIFQVRSSKTPGGCPCCCSPWESFKKIKNKQAYRCKCNYKVYPLKGTHLEHSRTPLVEILEIVYDLFRNKNGNPATALQRKTGREYDTCWANLQKISDWFGYCNEFQCFTPGSIIEIDEVYPKAQTNLGKYYPYKRGPSSERTFGMLVMTERDSPENNFRGISKAFCYDKAENKSIEKLIKKYIKPENNHCLYTDDSKEYIFLRFNGYLQHYKVTHSKGKYSEKYNDAETGEEKTCSTNTVEGLNEGVKTTIHRIYKGVTPAYMQLYADRVAFNHSNSSKNIFEVLTLLFDCLPGLNSEVTRKFKIKKRIRHNNKGNNLREAA